jgi:hypothetical protein
MKEFNIINGDKIRDEWECLFINIGVIYELLNSGYRFSWLNRHRFIATLLYRAYYEFNKNESNLPHETLLVNSFISTLRDPVNDWKHNAGWDYFDLTRVPTDLDYHHILMILFNYSPHIPDIDKMLRRLIILSGIIKIKDVFDVFSIEFTFKNIVNWFIKVMSNEVIVLPNLITIDKAIVLTFKKYKQNIYDQNIVIN